MSATIFLAICILGCDFLLYVLYQWNYGERRRGLSRRPRALRTTVEQQNVEPFLAASRKRAAGPKGNLRVIRGRAAVRETGGIIIETYRLYRVVPQRAARAVLLPRPAIN